MAGCPLWIISERFSRRLQCPLYPRFGSKADMCSAKRHVRFTLERGHSPVAITSATLKADLGTSSTPNLSLYLPSRITAAKIREESNVSIHTSLWRARLCPCIRLCLGGGRTIAQPQGPERLHGYNHRANHD